MINITNTSTVPQATVEEIVAFAVEPLAKQHNQPVKILFGHRRKTAKFPLDGRFRYSTDRTFVPEIEVKPTKDWPWPYHRQLFPYYPQIAADLQNEEEAAVWIVAHEVEHMRHWLSVGRAPALRMYHPLTAERLCEEAALRVLTAWRKR